jgi:cytochrome c oxidase subunit 2
LPGVAAGHFSEMDQTMQLLLRHAVARALWLAGVLCVGVFCRAAPALAQAPHPWQTGFQHPHSPVQVQIEALHWWVLITITLITLFVGVLLLYVLWRYSAGRNPVAGRTSHNTTIEVLWTVLPVLILFFMWLPSLRLVYYEDRTTQADLTIKVTGHQWYWEYNYPDQGNLDFTSYYVKDEDLKPGQLRLLDVDNPLVLPAGKNVRILTTSGDVIHSFFIPSFGVQRYAIPGRTIETWVRVDQPGQYYGECNQICGTNHSFMPISVRAVTPEAFTDWVQTAKTKFAADSPSGLPPPPPTPERLAAAQQVP